MVNKIGFTAMSQQVFVQADGSATWGLNGKCESAEIPVFIVNPEGGKSAAVKTVIDNVPSAFDGLPLSKVRFDSYDSEGNLNMVAVYEEKESEDEETEETEPTVSFSCGATSIHITEAYSQELIYGNDQGAGNLVGWNGLKGEQSQIDGVDVQTGELRETYTKQMKRHDVYSGSYRRTLHSLVGKVNATKFMCWEAGEVMFMGASYNAPLNGRGSDLVDVSFEFAIQLNENKYKYMDKTVSKKGFEYVWSIKETKLDKEDKKAKPAIKATYKAVVVKSADFSVLGL